VSSRFTDIRVFAGVAVQQV